MRHQVIFLLLSVATVKISAQQNKTSEKVNSINVEVRNLAKDKSVLEAFKAIDYLEPFTIKELMELTGNTRAAI